MPPIYIFFKLYLFLVGPPLMSHGQPPPAQGPPPGYQQHWNGPPRQNGPPRPPGPHQGPGGPPGPQQQRPPGIVCL